MKSLTAVSRTDRRLRLYIMNPLNSVIFLALSSRKSPGNSIWRMSSHMHKSWQSQSLRNRRWPVWLGVWFSTRLYTRRYAPTSLSLTVLPSWQSLYTFLSLRRASIEGPPSHRTETWIMPVPVRPTRELSYHSTSVSLDRLYTTPTLGWMGIVDVTHLPRHTVGANIALSRLMCSFSFRLYQWW